MMAGPAMEGVIAVVGWEKKVRVKNIYQRKSMFHMEMLNRYILHIFLVK